MRGTGAATPLGKHVVLVGAGNAHLLFVQQWGMKPVPGVMATLINDELTIPYSAMVPGHIAGEYVRERVMIDLVRLCPASGVRLLPEPVVRIDPAGRQVHFASRPPVAYDILSLGLGSLPTPPPGAEALAWSFRLRPLGELIARLDRLEAELRASPRWFHLVVVGGGASGCELALAIRKRFLTHPSFSLTLLHSGNRVLPNFPAHASQLMESALRSSGIDVRLNTRASGAEADAVLLGSKDRLLCDGVLWATDPEPPALLRESGLDLEERGYLRVGRTLQVPSRPEVYGTGDCVAFPDYPDLPRNGVMAVRQGRVLYDNIVAALTQGSPQPFRPQRRWLSLLNTADGQAIAGYGPAATAGRWVRRWKDRIDSRWMSMFVPPPPDVGTAQAMPCGGCGSKVPGDVLATALKQLDVVEDSRVVLGCAAAEDAAVFRTGPDDQVEVQTVDYFKSFVDDPYLFGRVAALHALSDLYAMNARPFAALAIATIPYARTSIQGRLLGELLAGAAREFRELGIALAGGHTTEGSELALGFSVTGHASEKSLFRKAGLRPGDCLVLTKPVGTGAVLASWMRGQCRAEWFAAAVRSMLVPNRAAAEVFAAEGVRACTDITGFGLAGHLLEMLEASGVSAELDRTAVTVLPGFDEVVRMGIVSSLQAGNARVAFRVEGGVLPAWLFDPQTSGGLLAAVEPGRADVVPQRLRAVGLPEAVVIGRVTELGKAPATITLR